MTKEEQRLKEYLRVVDVVLEVLDARLPFKSRNYRLHKMLGKKDRVVLLNKADLADEKITGQWLKILAGEKRPVLAFNAKSSFSPLKLEKLLLARHPRNLKYKRSLRLMIVGIPNVGKSTLINRLARRFAAKTGARAGITRGPQWIKMRGGWEMLDTPGLLPAHWRDDAGAFALAAIGALDFQIIDVQSTAKWLLQHFALQENTYFALARFYSLKKMEKGTEKERSPAFLLPAIGLARGCLGRGGQVDQEKAARLVLRDFGRGVLGRISLEKPGDYDHLFPQGS